MTLMWRCKLLKRSSDRSTDLWRRQTRQRSVVQWCVIRKFLWGAGEVRDLSERWTSNLLNSEVCAAEGDDEMHVQTTARSWTDHARVVFKDMIYQSAYQAWLGCLERIDPADNCKCLSLPDWDLTKFTLQECLVRLWASSLHGILAPIRFCSSGQNINVVVQSWLRHLWGWAPERAKLDFSCCKDSKSSSWCTNEAHVCLNFCGIKPRNTMKRIKFLLVL